MSSYKTEVTLNEKDSLQDMLNVEKNMIKLYSDAIAEGVSKGFITGIKELWNDTVADKLTVFLTMTERDYDRVRSAPEEQLNEIKGKFTKVRSELA